MRKDRMFKRNCNWTASQELSLVIGAAVVEDYLKKSCARPLEDKSFTGVSKRLSIALQELKQDVQKTIPRNRFVSGESFWTELGLLDQRDQPILDALSSAIAFEQDEDLESCCGVESGDNSCEQQEFEDFSSVKSHKLGWFDHVELYLVRSDQIPKSKIEHVVTAYVAANMSETCPNQSPDHPEVVHGENVSSPEVTASELSLDFTLSSSIEVNSVADVVHELIQQLSEEMFSPPLDGPSAAVPGAGIVPSDAGYFKASGQYKAVEEHPPASSVASGKEATERVKSVAVSSNPSATVVATPLHGRSIPRIRSVLKRRPGIATELPSTVKKSVTFSETGIVLNPYEERDRRIFRDSQRNILEDTLPRQQSTPKSNHTKRRGAKRKCVYDFDDDVEDVVEEDDEKSTSVTVCTQTEQTDSMEDMIRTIVEHTINSFKENEAKSEEDSVERDIQTILKATEASFHLDESKKKKRKQRKIDYLSDSMVELHKKVDRLEKRQKRSKKIRRLIVKKIVPAKAKPFTDRCTQTDALATAEASVATTFELSKPPPKPRAPRKRATKAKQPDDPESNAPKPKRVRRKVNSDQQTIPQCLNGDGGGGGGVRTTEASATVPDVLQKPSIIDGNRKVMKPDVVQMDDGQLVAEDSEDNLSQAFEIEESIPPLSPLRLRTLVDPRLIKGSHRKPPSIIDTQQNSPEVSSSPESPASHYSVSNFPVSADEDTESFNRQIIQLKIGPSSSDSSEQFVKQLKSRRQKPLKPYPKSPKLRPPPTKPVARYHVQKLYLSPAQDPTPSTLWKDPIISPMDTCKYLGQLLEPIISERRLPTLKDTYGEPCWFISLDVANRLPMDEEDTDDMALAQYPQFSQEFSPIAYTEGSNYFDEEHDLEWEFSSDSDVPYHSI